MTTNPEYWLANKLDWFAHITPQAVQIGLEDFELECDQSYRWLAGKLRQVHFSTVGTETEIDEHPGQLTIKREIEAIAEAIAVAKALFAKRSDWAEGVLRRHSAYDDRDFLSEVDSDAPLEPDALYRLDLNRDEYWLDQTWADSSVWIAARSEQWRNYRQMVCGMLELEVYLRSAAEKFCSRNDPPRWRDIEKKKRRIRFANELSLVFEEAYGREATINNWPDEAGNPVLGPWPAFFERMSCIALQIEAVPNLIGLLKDARRERIREIRVKLIRAIHPLGYPWQEDERID